MANLNLGSQTVISNDNGNVNWGSGVPTGSIVQVVYSGEMTAYHEFSSSSYTQATQLNVTITPKFANSLIWFQGWAKTQMNNSSQNTGQDYQIRRSVSSDNSLNATIAAASWQHYLNRGSYANDYYPPWTISRFDIPNTTHEITYQVWGRKYSGSSGNWKIGDTNHGANADYGSRGHTIAMEIKQ